MHPSRAIRGGRSKLLAGRRIVVAISGSIAAIEVPRIIRELIRHGAEVRAVMSPDAARIVTAEAIHFAAGERPVTELTGDVEHVTLMGPGEGRADLLLIAPATANTIGKIAHGIDDTPVTSFASVALGGGVPVLLAPAMHADMARNPAVRENLERLARWGVGLVPTQAVEGEEKLATPEEVAAAVLHRLARGPWAGRRVLILGGASQEPIDAVRSVTNESSGETALALAAEAHYRGAEVSLWLGALRVPVPTFLSARRWQRVADLERWIAGEPGIPPGTAAIWVPAALSDFTTEPVAGKVASLDRTEWTVTLRRAPKILPKLRAAAPRPTVLVAFKLEAGRSPRELERIARGMLRGEGRPDWVVANDRKNMGAPDAEVLLVGRGPARSFSGTKREVAAQLLDRVGDGLPGASGPDPGPGPAPDPARTPPRSRGSP